ncbi:hypothetical protein ACTMTJ_37305 [Phytohabitans sp. LJ34]|uniref:hypothetical protein n=1 Tax=Phytohabitans sp. LJ34 TaxID=3452217 RepID=UPI003F88D440
MSQGATGPADAPAPSARSTQGDPAAQVSAAAAEAEAIRSHRAPPGPVERVGTRARVGMLLVAALAVGGVVANWRPLDGDRADRRERPYIEVGQVGDPVSARSFEAKLISVRGARLLGVRSKGYETGGVWILVRVRVTATTEDTVIGYAALIDDRDREFLASGRFTQLFADSARTLQPGIPVEGEIAFEVPRDVATSMRLRLASRPFDQRMDGMAEITLPKVDTATVDGWATQKDAVIMEKPEVVP